MAFQAVPNGRKIELNGVQNGVPVVNVFYVTTDTEASEGPLTAIADAVIDWFNTNHNLWHSSYTLSNVTVTDVSVEDGVQVIVPPSTGGVGGDTSIAQAGNAAVCASLRTGRTGRSFRGRMYFGAIGSDQCDDAQTLKSTAAAAYATTVTSLISALETIGSTLVVVSRYAEKVLRVVALTTQIISVIVDTKIDSQRRRTAN